jgi:hypothetical protein
VSVPVRAVNTLSAVAKHGVYLEDGGVCTLAEFLELYVVAHVECVSQRSWLSMVVGRTKEGTGLTELNEGVEAMKGNINSHVELSAGV